MKCDVCNSNMLIVGSSEPYSEGNAVFYDRDFMCYNPKCENYADKKYTEKVPMNQAAREQG